MNSPYLSEPARLGDVIAAIQAMATYKFYKLDFESWADRISADKALAEHLCDRFRSRRRRNHSEGL
jgi:hypothetical protein